MDVNNECIAILWFNLWPSRRPWSRPWFVNLHQF